MRAETNRLQDAFEKCTRQLDSSRLENNLLKDRSGALERETNELRSLLHQTQTDLDRTVADLRSTKTTAEETIEGIRLGLREAATAAERSEETKASLAKELSDAKEDRGLESTRHKAEVLRLQRELKSSRADAKTHKDAALRFAEDLRNARERHSSTRGLHEQVKSRLSREEASHASTKKTLGTVATLAETLKGEKSALQRSLAQADRHGKEADSNCHELTNRLENLRTRNEDLKRLSDATTSELRSELSDRTNDLESANASLEVLQTELKDAERSLREQSFEKASLKAHLSVMESGRHELLNKRSELEESLEEVHDDLVVAHQELHTTKDLLEKAVLERNTLRTHRDTYLRSSERESFLEAKLLDQKKAFEDRLRHIHSILGLKFTTAVSSEVKEIRKHVPAIEPIVLSMPKSFRVPLLLLQQQEDNTTVATATKAAAVAVAVAARPPPQPRQQVKST